jgi:hypothetical protein
MEELFSAPVQPDSDEEDDLDWPLHVMALLAALQPLSERHAPRFRFAIRAPSPLGRHTGLADRPQGFDLSAARHGPRRVDIVALSIRHGGGGTVLPTVMVGHVVRTGQRSR